MKSNLFIALFMVLGISTAQANDQGAWVKVDASGNAIGGAIVCTPTVCGDENSDYSKATLAPGERYVLQSKADPVTGNVAGIGGNTPGVQVMVDLPTNTWTVITKQELSSASQTRVPPSPKVETVTVETFNPKQEPVIQTELVTKVDASELDWNAWWENWMIEWDFLADWHLNLFDWSNL